jgi:hypothetical protein
MHMILMAATLAIGSGDGRDGALDGRMVTGTTLDQLSERLDKVRSRDDVRRVMARPRFDAPNESRDRYLVESECPGKHYMVTFVFSESGRLAKLWIEEVIISQPTGSAGK